MGTASPFIHRQSTWVVDLCNTFIQFNEYASIFFGKLVFIMVLQALDIPYTEIQEFCQRWQVAELAIFGSALRKDFSPESDVDLLIAFKKSSLRGMFDLVRMQRELTTIFGRKVALVEKPAIENSENYIRRNEILNTAYVIFPA